MRTRRERTDRTLHPEQLRGVHRRRSEYIGGRLDLTADAELLALVRVHVAEQIGAEDDRNATTPSTFERDEAGIAYVRDLRLACGRETGGRSLAGKELVRRERGNEVRVVLHEQRDRLVVDQVAVFDATNSQPQSAVDGAGGVRVTGDVAVRRVGLLDGSEDLRIAELGGVDAIRR